MEMSPWRRTTNQPTSEYRATQSVDTLRLSFVKMAKIAGTGISTSNGFNFQSKKDMVPKFSSFWWLSSSLSWKCPHVTLSPSFGSLSRKSDKKVSSRYGLITFTACGSNFCKSHFLDFGLKELFTWSFLLCTTQCVGMNWMGWAELNGIDTWECHIWQH